MNKLQGFGLSLGLSASMMAVSSTVMAAPVEYAIDTPGMHASVNFKIQHLGIKIN